MGFIVKETSTGEVLPGLPSPMLISVGGGEAYRVPPEKEWDGISPKRQSDDGFWRLRDDKYDAPGIVYTRVRIGHTDQYYVLVNMQDMTPFMEDEEDRVFPYSMWFEAESKYEALRWAREKGPKSAENAYGGGPYQVLDILSVEQRA
jgi:hypothetical protein